MAPTPPRTSRTCHPDPTGRQVSHQVSQRGTRVALLLERGAVVSNVVSKVCPSCMTALGAVAVTAPRVQSIGRRQRSACAAVTD
eukprot:5317276-Pyramimonas_sp.AAC.1